MITLFEDINENTQRVARERHSSAKPAVKEVHVSWHQRVTSGLSGILHWKRSIILKNDLTGTQDDLVVKMKLVSGQEEHPTLALTKING
jgi:hypothetical protein